LISELERETFEKFEEYIKKHVEKYKQNEAKRMEENKKIEMEDVKQEATAKNPFDEVGGTYLKLERDKAKILLLTNWTVQKINKFKDDKGNIKEQMEFSADVLSEDGVACNKIFATTSFSALQGLKEVFSKYFPDTITPRLIRIKKIGEGKSTVYDIEEQKK
jgi:hypothetical protein